MRRASKWIISLLIVVVLGLTGALVYLLVGQRVEDDSGLVNSFETCASAGNPVMESHPRQCRDPKTNVTYTEEINDTPAMNTTSFSTMTYQSTKGVSIELNNWTENRTITNPMTITGRVPGNWSFEASFPVELWSADGQEMVRATASLQGDWMTNDLVPFVTTLQFESSESGSSGVLIIRKDNPSGLSEKDDALVLPVKF